MQLCRVYAITDPELLPDERLLTAVAQVLAAGVGTIQLRDKKNSPAQIKAAGERLLSLCQSHNAQLIINDDIDLAAAIGAHGVHLGRDDGSIEMARSKLGPTAIIGATCHNRIDWARQAQASGASYVAFGRFFSSITKPEAIAADMDLLIEAKNCLAVPIVAIGGVSSANANSLIRAGAASVAACASLFAAKDIETAAQSLLEVTQQ